MVTQHELEGTCHCGAIRAEFITTKPPAELELRACQCSFCSRHGALTVSDSAGRVVLHTKTGAIRYQFATRTAQSLICRDCGVYVAALLAEGDRYWSVLNVRGLALIEFAGRQPTPMVYDHETPAARIARRKAKWTPTVLELID